MQDKVKRIRTGYGSPESVNLSETNKLIPHRDKEYQTMLPSLREDYLEAILVFTARQKSPPSAQEIADVLSLQKPDTDIHVQELVTLGDITLRPDGLIDLTPAGRAIGQQTIKKHETLQCFLTEILGMDSSLASDEACKIEHMISDETIDRLGDYLRTPAAQSLHGEEGILAGSCIRSPLNGSCGLAQSLVDFDEGEHLIVRNILGRSCSKRLLDLGVVPGQQIIIRRKLKNQAIVVQVKDCDVALSPEIASAICVERMP